METTNTIANTSLQDQVTVTVRNYFDNLNGEEPVDLYKLVLEEIETPLFEATMTFTKNNQSKAARILGLARGTLRTKLKRYFDDTYIGSR